MEHVCINVVLGLEDQGLSREQINAATHDDPILQQLAEILVTQKWNEADQALLSYKRVKDELSVHNGYILRGNRISKSLIWSNFSDHKIG